MTGRFRALTAAAVAVVMLASLVVPALAGSRPSVPGPAAAPANVPPDVTVELYSVDMATATFRFTAADPDSLVEVRFTCESGTPVTRPFATFITLPKPHFGCPGYGLFYVTIEVFDDAGNQSWDQSPLGIGPVWSLNFPLPAITGHPFTVEAIFPDDYQLPADGGCRWEFRWGNDRSLIDNEWDETFGALLFDVPVVDGRCKTWTFTLPWVPYPQFEVHLRPFEFIGGDGTSDIVGQHMHRFMATVDGTNRKIASSTLPIVQVLPNTYTPIVGEPITYTRHLIGGAVDCCRPEWHAWLGSGDNPIQWHQSGGSTFTVTPQVPGNIKVAWERLGGNWRLASVYDPPVRYRDRTAPNTDAPVQRIGGGTVLAGSSPMTISWTGADSGWGIARFQLQRSTDGGTFKTVTLPWASARSIVQYLSHGHSYRYRVRAVDQAGLTGAWDYGPTFRPASVSEGNAKIQYGGSWFPEADPEALGGALRVSTAGGSVASARLYGRDIAWVAERSPAGGWATVYVDGRRSGRVYLLGSKEYPRRVVWSKHWTSPGWHTVRIVVEGTAGHPAVTIDAFLVNL